MKTIAYFTDTHLDEPGPGKHGADAHKNWHSILAELDTLDADQVICGGDIGAFSAYPEFFKALAMFKAVRVTPGNHDTSAQVRQLLSPQSSEKDFYYSESDANLKWIFLDSSTDKLGSQQMSWFENELQSDEREIILFIHHPVLTVNTIVDRKYPLENRNAVKNLLLQNGKQTTIFCGHYHIEDTTSEANIIQYVTPAVSYQIKKGTTNVEGDASYFGYRMIYIDGNKIETEVITLYPDDF